MHLPHFFLVKHIYIFPCQAAPKGSALGGWGSPLKDPSGGDVEEVEDSHIFYAHDDLTMDGDKSSFFVFEILFGVLVVF